MPYLGVALAALSVGAAPVAAAPAPKPYLGEFCGPIALSDAGAGSLMQHLSQWNARAGSDADAYAARPEDTDAPGQLFRFRDPAAPLALIDRRRGVCTLIYPGARTADPVLEELSTETLPVGDKDAPSPWRKVVVHRFGPPGPLRYFLKVGESAGYGLCSTIFEDLRLKDNSPATMVRVSACRLGPDEKLDNG